MMKNWKLITSKVPNGKLPNPSPINLANQLQVTRWNLPPRLQRRQHNSNLYPPTNSPPITVPHNPHALHHAYAPHSNQLPCQLPPLHPLRPNNNSLPLHGKRPPNPSHKRSLPSTHPNIKLPPHIPHNRSILRSLLAALVLTQPLPRRNRLPNRPLRRIAQWGGPCLTNAYYPLETA